MNLSAIPPRSSQPATPSVAPVRVAASALPAGPASASTSAAPDTSFTGSAATTNLTPEALELVAQLKARDTEVRQHEQAHMATAGGLATSGASYTYQRGPNGVDYAIGGEVHIDTSPGRTAQETIERARTIQAAALAPASPSGADQAVAAQAQQMELQARSELAVQQAQELVASNGNKVSQTYQQLPLVPPKLDIYA
ncbi:catalase [Pseudoduganella sp. FT93W]|uniref:Catalase n=1 Tax=Duganella fentianensis TaxID=2692177 RepID=A0A845HWE1_9BURK|nr:putative metalloprotease CJM1_0395 family protein [Duganella fentianensis]MYN45329.1 catalase [Duganella fentianensis]